MAPKRDPRGGRSGPDRPRQEGKRQIDLPKVSSVESVDATDLKTSPTVKSAGKASFRLSFQSLPGNECRLHASGFRKLSSAPGCILRLRGLHQDVFLEAWLSSTVSFDTVEVSSDISYLLHSSEVEVLSFANECQECRTLSLRFTFLGSSKQDKQLDGCSATEWKALFRRNFFDKVIYKGLRTTLQTSLCTVLADVVSISLNVSEDKNESNVCGFLGSRTDLLVEMNSSEDPCPPSSVSHENLGHLLIVGEPGTGKSFQMRAEEVKHKQNGRATFVVNVENLTTGEHQGVSSRVVVHELFERAKQSYPSTIFVDDLHSICGSAGTSSVGSSWALNYVARSIVEELRAIQENMKDVFLVASSLSLEALSNSSVFGNRVIHLAIPSTLEEKASCLQTCFQDVVGTAHLSHEQWIRIAENTNGYSQRDYRHLVELAVTTSFEKKAQLDCTEDELVECTRRIQPSALRQFDVSVPDVTWNDIGGSDEAKQALQEVVHWALGNQREIFQQYNLQPPRGILLYGPPGCSKTMLAKALANESKLNFISVKGPEVFSKWVGDSEKAVRNIFTRARAASPCVVFIDELDGMCGHRGQGGVADRVISQFLTELDGLPSALSETGDSLIFVAATNRPDNIDGAVLRPGRIDKLVHVGLPGWEERRAIVAIQFRRMPTAPDVTPDFIASHTEGYSGAEVVAVVKEAAFHALGVSISSDFVTKDDVLEALRKVQPRTKQEDVDWYRNWRHHTT